MPDYLPEDLHTRIGPSATAYTLFKKAAIVLESYTKSIYKDLQSLTFVQVRFSQCFFEMSISQFLLIFFVDVSVQRASQQNDTGTSLVCKW